MARAVDRGTLVVLRLLSLLISSFCGRFVVEKNSISVLAPESITGKQDSAIGNFAAPDYGGSMILDVKLPEKGADGSKPFDTSFKRTSVKPNPSVALLDRGDYPKKNRRLSSEELLLHQSSSPTIGRDGRVYACIGNNAYAFNLDGTPEWTADLNDTCQLLVSPAINNDGRVYVAANHRVYIISYSEELNFLSVWNLFNGTSLDGSMLGSKPITGLALMDNGTSILINAGVAGLYAVAEDGSPLWSTSGDFNSKDVTFSSGTFCSKKDKICYFHFSPAIDYCAGSIYLDDLADSTYKWLAIRNRWMEAIREVAL